MSLISVYLCLSTYYSLHSKNVTKKVGLTNHSDLGLRKNCLSVTAMLVTYLTEEYKRKIMFFLNCQKCLFNAQNVLGPLLSLYIYFFILKFLLKDQKMLNLRRIKNDLRGPSASLMHFSKQTQEKRLVFREKLRSFK